MILEAIIGTLVAAAIGTPLVYILDKWKKEMDESK